jgi:hypothetical protein
MKQILLLVVVVTLATFVRPIESADGLFYSDIRELKVPASSGSHESNLLATPDGRVYLSWLEPVDESTVALRIAQRTTEGWSEPRQIASGDDWFVNWADYPGLAAFGTEGLAAYWLVHNGKGTYAYDLHIALSNDAGTTWSMPVVPHDDGTATQHGFPSFLPWADGKLFVTWLDGRINARGKSVPASGEWPTGDMTLRSALIDSQGKLSEESLLDDSVCSCCATAAAITAHGALIAYRDRTSDDIRDISLRRHLGGQWLDARKLNADHWEIAGCPINGPALASENNRVGVAWFTAADDIPRVLFKYSTDSGSTFSKIISIDDGRPLGRVDTVMLADGSMLISWLEVGLQGEELRFCRVTLDGTKGQSYTLVSSDRGRTIGVPRMVLQGDQVFFTWTQPTEPMSIRVAVMTIKKT